MSPPRGLLQSARRDRLLDSGICRNDQGGGLGQLAVAVFVFSAGAAGAGAGFVPADLAAFADEGLVANDHGKVTFKYIDSNTDADPGLYPAGLGIGVGRLKSLNCIIGVNPQAG